VDESPYLDLRDGWAGFTGEQARRGSDLLRSVGQKTRKAEREAGPVRFEFDTIDRGAYERLIEWKSARRAHTGTFDVLSLAWMREMLDRILETRTDPFAGVLSVLYVGDQVGAVHLGMRSDTVMHYWFAAYNHQLQRYSPGLILLLQMVKSAADSGITMLRLGKGDEAYKGRFANGATSVASGSVDCRLTRRVANAFWYAARRVSHHSPMVAALARSVKRRRLAMQGSD